MTLAPNDAILRIYDTVAEPDLWAGVLDEIADQINGMGAILFEWDVGTDGRHLHAPRYSSFFEADLIEGYLQRYGTEEGRDQDVFEVHSLRHDGIDLIDDDVLAPSKAEFAQLRNVAALARFGIGHRAAGLLNKDNTAHGRFSVQLGADRGKLNDKERAYLGQVLPHVAKALDLGRPLHQLSRRYKGMLAAMDHLRTGLCILDTQGRAMAMNKEFERQVQDYAVFRIGRDGVLHMQSDFDAQQLHALQSQLHHHGRFGARPRKEAIQASARHFLCVELAPLSRLEEAGNAPLDGFVMLSTDTSRPINCNIDLFLQAYQLTPAEAALANGISRGLTNAQISQERGRALATINAQVKSVLSKTDCANRTQFARLLSRFSSDFVLPSAPDI